MSFLQTSVVAILIGILVAVYDIYCGDASGSLSQQVTPVPPINDANAWPELGKRKRVNAYQGPTQRPTSPPANQQPNPNNNQPNAGRTNPTSNRNVGVDLSYGLLNNQNVVRANQNRPGTAAANNRNVGFDLSYGVNANANRNFVATRTTQNILNVNSNQNSNAANAAPTNRNVPVGFPTASQGQPIKAQNPVAGSASQGQTVKPQNPQPNPVAGSAGQGATVKPQNPQPNPVAGQNGGAAVQTPGANVVSPGQKAASPATGSNVNANTQNKNSVPGSNAGSNRAPSSTPAPGPSAEDDELREFSETLLRKDTNNAAKYVTINYQAKTTSRSTDDEAPQPLLTIRPEAFEIPTIARLMLLHNNYIIETNANEHVTVQEKAEENSLLDTMLSTPVMQTTRKFLMDKGAISRDPKDFRDKLKEMWFGMYSRGGGKIGSSGFEHVFLAELKGNDVSGQHNWLYFNEAEAKKQANYLGYLKKIEFGNKGAILKHHFTLAGKDKPVGSMFIGTSPELEMALYSTCFLLRADRVCPLKLGGNRFIIRTFTFRYRGKNLVGSAFPEI